MPFCSSDFPGKIKGHVNTLSFSSSLVIPAGQADVNMKRPHSIFDYCSRGDLSFLICLPFILSQQTGHRNFRLGANFLFEHSKLLLTDVRLTVRSFLSSSYESLSNLSTFSFDYSFYFFLMYQGNTTTCPGTKILTSRYLSNSECNLTFSFPL